MEGRTLWCTNSSLFKRYDEWYIYHGEKQTQTFMQLKPNAPILNNVLHELKTIYSLPTSTQLTSVAKNAPSEAQKKLKNTISTDLGALWIKSQRAIQENKDLIIGGSIGIAGILSTWFIIKNLKNPLYMPYWYNGIFF